MGHTHAPLNTTNAVSFRGLLLQQKPRRSARLLLTEMLRPRQWELLYANPSACVNRVSFQLMIRSGRTRVEPQVVGEDPGAKKAIHAGEYGTSDCAYGTYH